MILAICLLLPLFCGCSSDDSSEMNEHPTINDIQFTEQGSKREVLYAIDGSKGLTLDESISSQISIAANKTISGDGFTFSEEFDTDNLSSLPDYSTVKQWSDKAVAKAKTSYWVRYQLPSQVAMFKLRIAYVDGINVGVEHNAAQKIVIENKNANVSAQGQNYVTEYEMPHLMEGNTYVEHEVTAGGNKVLNYAMEWNDHMKHSRWVAYSYDAITGVKNVTRSDDAWAVDPLLPESMRVDNSWHTNDGFDRGHLCASDDRSFSTEANKQTFYFSNMSPQLNSFNGGYWVTFEQLLNSWVRKDNAFGSVYDKIYVAKGGTLDKLLIDYKGTKAGGDGVMPATDSNGFTSKGLPVPQYYFIAVLAHRANQLVDIATSYQAIGFWVEHRDDYGYTFEHPLNRDDTKANAISIDELESKTGIDFFCNLPDYIEDEVESSYNVTDWAW